MQALLACGRLSVSRFSRAYRAFTLFMMGAIVLGLAAAWQPRLKSRLRLAPASLDLASITRHTRLTDAGLAGSVSPATCLPMS
jgi:hypothetical protein